MVSFDRALVASLWGSRFKEWVCSPSVGRSGGIAIIWNSRVIGVTETLVGEFSVSIRICNGDGTEWWLSGIYGPCRYRERKAFWNELADLYGFCGEKWCLGGDFNVVRYTTEKSNGGLVTRSMREFNAFIQEVNLRDPSMGNASFTWSNMRQNVVCRRLDRFLVSAGWEGCFPHYSVKALPRTTSDHCPILIDSSRIRWGPSPFRFENMWMLHPDFKRNIKRWWGEESFSGWEGYRFMLRLKSLKAKLRNWSREAFGDVEGQKLAAEGRLLVLDRTEGEGGLDNSLRTERENLLLMVADLAQKEETMWRQRSKITWAKEGDGNTKFFHKVANGNRNRNLIEKLEVEDGRVVEEEADIEREVIKFFKNLYTRDEHVGWGIEGLNWSPIGNSEAAWLERPFGLEEIRKAVFSCGKDKSPGPDGFSMSFFQSCWDLVKGDLVKVLDEFFRSGIVNGNTNETYICLIPKRNSPVKIADFRPVSLVSSLYKIISKILASRLREVLGSTISQAQGAFVQKRQILDAVLIANEVVEEARKCKRKGLVLKLDLEKAYDHVDWDFLDDVLVRKGFGVKWRSWIRGCLESVNFSVMINGQPKGKFKASRGLRQGDPLSPFLFTLVSDVLSRLIERAQESEIVHGLVSGQDRVEVSHLQFADDTIILVEGKEEYWLKVLEVLTLFCQASGMKINKKKCSLYGIHYSEEELGRLARSWGCEVGNWPMVYLGLPLGGNPSASGFWNPVIEKVENRLQNWKRACLSKGGRMTLIQSVLCSIPSYFMSLFSMPKGVAAKIEGLMRTFLWKGDGNSNGRNLVRWEEVTRAKEDGGLGFGLLRDRNVALMAKWLWRFPLETNSLWHRIIKSKYGLDDNGWDSRVQAFGSRRSPWRDIAKGYHSYWQCCRFSVGNGERIRFWEDKWLQEGVLNTLFPRLFAVSAKRNVPVRDFVSCQQLPLCWDFGFRRNLTEVEIGEVARLLEIVGRVTLSSSRGDKRCWEIEESGNFTCKSYRLFLAGNRGRGVFPPVEFIWKAQTPPKVKFLVWVVAKGKVNTCDMLQRRNPRSCLLPSWCVLCKEKVESCDHLFLHCRFSLSIWWKLLALFGVSWVTPKGCFQLMSFSLELLGKRKRGQVLLQCFVHAMVWSIWLERNSRIFQDHRGATAEEVWERVKFWAALWASVSGHFKDYHYSTILRDFGAVLC